MSDERELLIQRVKTARGMGEVKGWKSERARIIDEARRGVEECEKKLETAQRFSPVWYGLRDVVDALEDLLRWLEGE